MNTAYVKLLQSKIDNLESSSFDLEAWKSSTIVSLIKIFGKDDPRIRLIEDLKVDYGSWALRDATSSYNPALTCKNKGREILKSLIEELELTTPSIPTHYQTMINEGDSDGLRKELGKEKKETLVEMLAQHLLSH